MANNDQANENGDQAVNQADIDAILVEVDFPATRDDLISAAEDADTDEAIVVLFQSIPDQEYASSSDVNQAINERGVKEQNR